MRLINETRSLLAIAGSEQNETRIPVIPSRRTEAGRARIAHYDPHGTAARAFADLAANLCPLITLAERAPSLLCVTSAQRRQGRSLVAANLAISLAGGGHRTLLVEADANHPCQRSIFHEIDDALCAVGASPIQSTDVDGLDLLADRSRLHAAIARETARFSMSTFDSLRPLLSEGYDVLVIDAAPCCEWSRERAAWLEDVRIVNVTEASATQSASECAECFDGATEHRVFNRSARRHVLSGTARSHSSRFWRL